MNLEAWEVCVSVRVWHFEEILSGKKWQIRNG